MAVWPSTEIKVPMPGLFKPEVYLHQLPSPFLLGYPHGMHMASVESWAAHMNAIGRQLSPGQDSARDGRPVDVQAGDDVDGGNNSPHDSPSSA